MIIKFLNNFNIEIIKNNFYIYAVNVSVIRPGIIVFPRPDGPKYKTKVAKLGQYVLLCIYA